jgi:hypothetical protein
MLSTVVHPNKAHLSPDELVLSEVFAAFEYIGL